MNKRAGHNIVIIGCGNVAWHLAKQLSALNKHHLFVYNHRPNPALADFEALLKCTVAGSLDAVISDADFYFVCVSDRSISKVSAKINCALPEALILHTSGSAKLGALKNVHPNKGVFYPLQTFSKQDALDWKEIPLILEAANGSAETRLQALAGLFSNRLHLMDYRQRLKLHLSAVLVNNFTNALYAAAANITAQDKNNTSFEMLLPLIRQTTNKLQKLSPLAAQTGPAKRHDAVVMKKHLRLLEEDPALKKIYKQLSKLIIKQQAHAQL